jgi:tetratricopeptide (TPR) repeat protein
MDGNVAVDWGAIARALQPLADLPSSPQPRWGALVILDDHPSMAVWRGAADRFLATLREAGVARIEVYGLDTDIDDPAELALHGTSGRPATAPDVPGAGQWIVLVLTDGTGAAWHTGAVQPLLRRWGSTLPIAVVQLLPQQRWYRTGVRPRRLRLHAPAAGSANARLGWEPHGAVPDVLDDAANPTDAAADPGGGPVPVPVLELDPHWLSAWVRLLTGGDSQLPALLAAPGPPAEVPTEPAEPGTTARTRVREFTSWATPTALTLATHLAAAPLNLPVMRAVQQELVRRSDTSHLSEVLNSGLLRPVAAGPAATGAGGVTFEFHSGVREELLAVGRRADAVRVLRVVDRCLGSTVPAVHGLSQVVDDPDTTPVPEVTPETEPFVQVERAVLRALSGRYLARARRLDDKLTGRTPPPATQGATIGIPTATDDHATEGARVSSSTVAEPTTSGGTSTRAPVIWGNVPPRNPNFTGRESLMAHLHERIRSGTTAVLPHALHGMGGVGKSQLAVEYVYRHQSDFELIWWIPAERPPQIENALVELAQRLQLPGGPQANTAVPAVREALRLGRPYANWLLILDNAESPEAVRGYFPAGGPGSIMVTSRNPQWTSIAQPLEVDVFTREESIELLRQRGPELSDEDADRLAEALGDLPLALDQAAAWRAETGMPASEYLRLFEQKRTALLEVSAPLDYQLPVAAAWNVSLDRLAISSPGALRLLQVCAFFAPLPIPRTLFYRTQASDVPPELEGVLRDPIQLGRAIREINKYALAKIDHRTNSIQMHRLVQAVLVDQLTDAERESTRHHAHTMLAASDPRDPNSPDQWRTYGDLYPHTMAAGAYRSTDPWVRQLVDNVSRYLYWWGSHEAAYDLAERAHEARRDQLGADNPATLQAGHWMGWLLFVLGRFQEAAELNAEIVRTYRETSAEDTEDFLRALGAVAADHRVAGDFAAALELAQDVYDRHVRALGPEDPETINAAHNLGVSLRLSGHLRRAYEIDYRNQQLRTQLYGTDYPVTLESTRNLITGRRELGDYVGARAEAQAVADQLRHQLVEGHPQILRSLRTLSTVLRKAGDHRAAREVSEEAYEGLVTRYGEGHPDTLAAMLNLSIDLRQTGDMDTAAELGEKAYEGYRTLIGEAHPHTIAARLNWAVTQRLRGNLAQARRINEEGFAALREQLGEDHPLTLSAAVNLATDLYAHGQYPAAYERDRDAVRRLVRGFGEDHPTTLAAQGNMAIDLIALGREEEAHELHADTVARCQRVLGTDHPATVVATDLTTRADCDLDPLPL